MLTGVRADKYSWLNTDLTIYTALKSQMFAGVSGFYEQCKRAKNMQPIIQRQNTETWEDRRWWERSGPRFFSQINRPFEQQVTRHPETVSFATAILAVGFLGGNSYTGDF